MIYLLSILTFGVAVFLFVNFLQGWNRKRRTRLVLLKRREKKSIESLFIKILMPAIELLEPLMARVEFKGYRGYIEKYLVRAGLEGQIVVEEFWGYQLLMAVVLFGLAHLIPFLPAGWFFSVISFVFGLVWPLLWLRSLRKKRVEDITYRLPFVLDLLTLSVEAGLDFISAVARLVEKGEKSVVAEELRLMLGQIRLGRSRAEALNLFKNRLFHPAIDSFVAMLLQAERLGASIGPVLKAHAENLRTERFARAEKAGAVAAQKALVPLVFCIMPVVFIVIFGPLFVMWQTGMFNKLF